VCRFPVKIRPCSRPFPSESRQICAGICDVKLPGYAYFGTQYGKQVCPAKTVLSTNGLKLKINISLHESALRLTVLLLHDPSSRLLHGLSRLHPQLPRQLRREMRWVQYLSIGTFEGVAGMISCMPPANRPSIVDQTVVDVVRGDVRSGTGCTMPHATASILVHKKPARLLLENMACACLRMATASTLFHDRGRRLLLLRRQHASVQQKLRFLRVTKARSASCTTTAGLLWVFPRMAKYCCSAW